MEDAFKEPADHRLEEGVETSKRISEARLIANRLNAKKSTGPRTEKGKRRSSMNALKHGMTSRFAMLADEDPDAFERRLFGWHDEFEPETDSERYRVEHAVHSSWLVQRARTGGLGAALPKGTDGARPEART